MQVLQFGVFPPPDGGVQANVKDIRDYLREQNIRCGVIHLSRHRRADQDDVFYPKTPLEVVKTAMSFPADIWHFHLGGSVTRELLGLYGLGTFMPGKKTVLTFHSGGYPSSADARRAQPVRDFVFRRFDRIVGVNAEIVEMFARMGVARDKIRLILPFALPSRPPQAEIPPAIADFIVCHSPVLLAVCLLEPEYDIAMQIDAMAQLLETYPRAGLIIIGAGSLEADLRSHIATKTYSDSILLCGNVPRPATLNVMVRADVFLRTTWYDGDAVSVREALHFSVPVIASDNGMRPAGVSLIPARSLQALVTKIKSVLAGPKALRTAKPGSVENLAAVLELYRELAANE
jgi:glycosyltransferase involved in cell wall biosynthesis